MRGKRRDGGKKEEERRRKEEERRERGREEVREVGGKMSGNCGGMKEEVQKKEQNVELKKR